jgi:hypothetical protein
MKSIQKRLFARRVMNLAAQAKRSEMQADPALREWYEVKVPSTYEESMNRFMKEYTKFYRFDITQPQMHNMDGN